MNTKFLMIGIMGVAIVGMSMGFATNNITANVQGFGTTNQEIIDNPQGITDVVVNFGFGGLPDNDITDCKAKFFNAAGIVTLDADSKVICKLSNEAGNLIGEGEASADGSSNIITVNVLCDSTSPFDGPFDEPCDAQEVHDVKIIVFGPEKTTA